MKTLALITARSGSKGIPNKNIVDLLGRPLIAHTILPALRAKEDGLLSRVVVSTDSEQYASVASHWGAEVPFLRPHSISNDTSKSIDAVIHALDFFFACGEIFDRVLLLQPTSPQRNFFDIKESIGLMQSNENAESVVSVYKDEHVNEFVSYYCEESGYGIPLSQEHNKGHSRQKMPTRFVRNGAIYLAKVSLVREKKTIIADQPYLYIMPKYRSFDIDTPEDLEIVKKLLI